MELLLSRPAVVALAVLGALLSTAASILELRKIVSPRGALILNYAGYGFMIASMALFAFSALRGPAA